MMKGAGSLAASWSAPARVPPRADPIETKLETSLIQSLKHMGEGGHEAVSCVSDCRFGDVRHSWRECLDKCVSNHLLRSTLLTMLPAEHHTPHAMTAELPDELHQIAVVKDGVLLSIQRGSEL